MNYIFTDLGRTENHPGAAMHLAINDAGNVVGMRYFQSDYHGFLYEKGVFTDLSQMHSFAPRDINNANIVVGVWNNQGLLYENGTIINILDNCEPSAINDRGQIVGVSNPPDGNYYAFFYDNGNVSNLQDNLLPIYKQSYGSDINNSGEIAGEIHVVQASPPSPGPAFLYDKSNVVYISQGSQMHARAINCSGQIVGRYDVQSGHHAFLYDRESGITDIHTMTSDWRSDALGINDCGKVVGVLIPHSNPGPTKAFLYENGSMVDLEGYLPKGSGWDALLVAKGINNRGQIVGIGTIKGDYHIFLATPMA